MDFKKPLILFKPAGVPREWSWFVLGELRNVKSGRAAMAEVLAAHRKRFNGRIPPGSTLILPPYLSEGIDIYADVVKQGGRKQALADYLAGLKPPDEFSPRSFEAVGKLWDMLNGEGGRK